MPATQNIELTAPVNRDYSLRIARGLLETGWKLIRIPNGGRLAANRQLLVLETDKSEVRFRIFVYRIAKGARGRFNEYKIQITSTYPKGHVPRLSNYQDVVLGYFPQRDIFVGFDPRRMEFGGESGTSASYLNGEGLTWDSRDEIRILRHGARVLPEGIEYHAFFKSPCLAEYLLNLGTIHAGTYVGSGEYSEAITKNGNNRSGLSVPADSASGEALILRGPKQDVTRRRVDNALIEACERADIKRLRRARLTPEQFQAIKRACEDNGHLGEEIILRNERRRLIRARKKDLAKKIRWVSQESIGEGYDILSFEVSGEERLIEVKATIGNGRTFEMSNNEWDVAQESANKYYIYRVLKVRSSNPQVRILRNPCDIEARGIIQKSPTGWLITLAR
jgi:Domain of unknown function (DUF3883)